MRFSSSKCARASRSIPAMIPSAEVISSRALASFCATCVSRDARQWKYHQSTRPGDCSPFCLEAIVSPPLRQTPTIPRKGYPGRRTGFTRSRLTVGIEFSCCGALVCCCSRIAPHEEETRCTTHACLLSCPDVTVFPF